MPSRTSCPSIACSRIASMSAYCASSAARVMSAMPSTTHGSRAVGLFLDSWCGGVQRRGAPSSSRKERACATKQRAATRKGACLPSPEAAELGATSATMRRIAAIFDAHKQNIGLCLAGHCCFAPHQPGRTVLTRCKAQHFPPAHAGWVAAQWTQMTGALAAGLGKTTGRLLPRLRLRLLPLARATTAQPQRRRPARPRQTMRMTSSACCSSARRR